MSAMVLFHVDGRAMAAPLAQVVEVVRAAGVEPLVGLRAPVTGVLQLRGRPVPVVDLRSTAYPGQAGDALVVASPDAGTDTLVLAVDSVTEVIPADAIRDSEPPSAGMPDYVVATVHVPSTPEAVLAVDLHRLAGLTPPGEG